MHGLTLRSIVLLASALALGACRFDGGGVFVAQQAADRGPADGDAAGPPDLDAGPPPDAGADIAIVLPDGTPDVPTPDLGQGCTQPRKCENDIYFECVQGVLKQQQMCTLGCDAAKLRCATFIPSNVAPKFLGLGAADWNIVQEIVLDTTSGIVTVAGQQTSYPSGVNFFGTPEYAIVTLRRLFVGPGARLWVRGKRPLVIIGEAMRIEGTLDAAAHGTSPGPGGGAGGGSDGGDGSGCGAGFGGRNLKTLQAIYSGGAGGSFGGKGGNGGGSDDDKGPASRAICGISELLPLVGGSGGGGGDGVWDSGGKGGGGGGAIQLTATVSIEVMKTGVINAGGGGGRRGSGWPGSGGGGGSGGAVLLEAPRVFVEGAVVAEGGGGGGGGIFGDGGGDGADAKSDGTRATGGSAGKDLFGARGGNGGAGSGNGKLEAGSGEDESPAGGGGGGGSGRIVFRTADGKREGTGTVSPDKDPARKLLKITAQ